MTSPPKEPTEQQELDAADAADRAVGLGLPMDLWEAGRDQALRKIMRDAAGQNDMFDRRDDLVFLLVVALDRCMYEHELGYGEQYGNTELGVCCQNAMRAHYDHHKERQIERSKRATETPR